MLLTGASGMLGHYVAQQCRNYDLITLGRSDTNSIICDLEKETPDFTVDFPSGFHLVVHAAGTQDASRALSLNLEGTRRLLRALEHVRTERFVYISSTQVYGKTEGNGIREADHLWTSGKVGQSQALAEEEITRFCDEKGVTLTILRPVSMFGRGMGGWGARMAAQVLSGSYFNIREADAGISLVTAYDVARVIPLISPVGGTYNVTDGRVHSMRDLAMAMGNNRGKAKKPFWLPVKWARVLSRLGDRLELAARFIDSRELSRRTTSLTFSSEKLQNALPDFIFHDTAAVTGRTDSDYPYEDD